MKGLEKFTVLSVDGVMTIILSLLVLAMVALILVWPIKALFNLKIDVSKCVKQLLIYICIFAFSALAMYSYVFSIGFENTSYIPTSQKWIYQFHTKFPYNAERAEYLKRLEEIIDLWH